MIIFRAYVSFQEETLYLLAIASHPPHTHTYPTPTPVEKLIYFLFLEPDMDPVRIFHTNGIIGDWLL